MYCYKVTPEPSLLQAEQLQLPQPVLIGEVLQSSDHLRAPIIIIIFIISISTSSSISFAALLNSLSQPMSFPFVSISPPHSPVSMQLSIAWLPAAGLNHTRGQQKGRWWSPLSGDQWHDKRKRNENAPGEVQIGH